MGAPLWRVSPWVSLWHTLEKCLSWVHLSDEHHVGWFRDTHSGLYLLWVHLSGEHHLGWVPDLHWGLCLWKVHLSGEYHLGEPVTHIGCNAFHGCTSLASITLSESLTHIGKNAFHGCTSLARITSPESFKLKAFLTRELWNISPAVVTIPARQGTKRLRKEWVREQSSVQTCSDANCPQIVTTCRKTSVWLWPRDELDALLDFLMHTAKLNPVGRYFASNTGVKGQDVSMFMGDQHPETITGTKWHQHVFTRWFPPFTSLRAKKNKKFSLHQIHIGSWCTVHLLFMPPVRYEFQLPPYFLNNARALGCLEGAGFVRFWLSHHVPWTTCLRQNHTVGGRNRPPPWMCQTISKVESSIYLINSFRLFSINGTLWRTKCSVWRIVWRMRRQPNIRNNMRTWENKTISEGPGKGPLFFCENSFTQNGIGNGI